MGLVFGAVKGIAAAFGAGTAVTKAVGVGGALAAATGALANSSIQKQHFRNQQQNLTQAKQQRDTTNRRRFQLQQQRLRVMRGGSGFDLDSRTFTLNELADQAAYKVQMNYDDANYQASIGQYNSAIDSVNMRMPGIFLNAFSDSLSSMRKSYEVTNYYNLKEAESESYYNRMLGF